MNRFFERDEYRRGFPRRAYARLDDVEPIAPRPDDDLTLVLDAVDAEWKGFGRDAPFDLADPGLRSRIANRWTGDRRSGGEREVDGYDEVPIYRLEVTLAPGNPWLSLLPRDEETWIAIDLSDRATDLPVDVYGGLFAAPVRAFLHAKPTPAPSAALTAVFDMTTWPDASERDLLDALSTPCTVERLACLDVGQGSACALLCGCGVVVSYFDVGTGSGRNAPTAPAQINFCTCDGPPVILSHWDTDHWAGATGHAGLKALDWIVPRQTISMTHSAFASDVLRTGGRMLVVGRGAGPLTWRGRGQTFDLRRANGTGRNGSGLALIVEDRRRSRRSWILTGDAGYHLLAQPVPKDVAAMTVPHHGADMGPKSVPPTRSPAGYARLLYSFGPGNGHGPKKPPVRHPVAATVKAHDRAGWLQGAWVGAAGGLTRAGGDVLATANHPSSHLGGCAAGWLGPPRGLPGHPFCPEPLHVPQT